MGGGKPEQDDEDDLPDAITTGHSAAGHLIHLAFFGQSVEWEKSLDHRDLPVDAPLFVDAQLSMFETLDIQFDDSDNDSDRDLPEIESYRNEVSAEQWSGWDLMLSNGWHKKQSACQALCKAYALNRGRMVVAALRNMEEVCVCVRACARNEIDEYSQLLSQCDARLWCAEMDCVDREKALPRRSPAARRVSWDASRGPASCFHPVYEDGDVSSSLQVFVQLPHSSVCLCAYSIHVHKSLHSIPTDPA